MLAGRMVIVSDSADRDDLRQFKAIRRFIRRAAETRLDDPLPASIRLMRELEAEVDVAWATLVARWRECGWNDADIGAALGISRQAVQQKWPRDDDAIFLPR